ncbi:flagellar basal body P-ring formation chaperone FlgA [Buchnera aphidicola]|uniref:flagellar basal body P-ring formation chaperone FlgA n=1 Tax=Buchnera aphidicola TaxID=9 RepID=UPI0021C7221F|nr:flagellar basal body P-ring formation chaperone FlgA [Buchnera aphidicola]
MKLIKTIIFFLLFFLTCTSNAHNLTEKLNDFFKKTFPHKKNVTVIIRTPLKKNFFCEKPVFSFPNNLNRLGLTHILLICGKKHHYLKVEFQQKGKYIVANRKIPRGTKITESDLKVEIGQLENLPYNTCIHKKDVINKVNLRDIFPLQPITSFIIRPFWTVRINQSIKIIIRGENFFISSQATSLSNGSENERIRIKTKNGKIITGIVNKNGEVIVSL